MDIELSEIRDFLAAHAPFDRLSPAALDAVPRQLSVRYLRRGTDVPPPDADAAYLYVVRQGAVEMRDRAGELVDKLGEGESCPLACDEDLGAVLTAVTAEDTLVYLLPCQALSAMRRDHPEFGRHFDAGLTGRLASALSAIRARVGARAGLMATAVGSLVRGEPVSAPSDLSIREAAQLMTDRRVSSLLVIDGGRLTGLVTDRDLRSRCLAAGRDSDDPVSTIMTTGVHTIGPDTAAFEALVQMTRLNVHHLPVTDHTGVVGVVTTTDLVRHESANPVYLVGEILKAPSADVLVQASRRLPQLQVQLVDAGASARQVGEALSTLYDMLTVRLLQLAEHRLGAPPVPYAWITGGSHARREQTVHADQDNALIIDDRMRDGDDAYFASLAGFVNDGLHACGLVRCPGQVMAGNPRWRQQLGRWRESFDTWINRPEPEALMLSSIFFDLRVLHGEPSLHERLQEETLRLARANGIFLACMARNAVTHRPPLGFFRQLVLERGGAHARTLDLKHRGVVPVVDLARVYALAQGIAAINTTERLRAASGTPALTAEDARNLEDALELIALRRALHQADQLRTGAAPDNFLPPDTLSPLERRHLTDAFRVVATMQQVLAQRYAVTHLS